MGLMLNFHCKDCECKKSFFTGFIKDDTSKISWELFNCPSCGDLSLRAVPCDYDADTRMYLPIHNRTQKCKECGSGMNDVQHARQLVCPNCQGTNCICYKSAARE